jgi:tyrosine-protein phosphatase SIW14
MSSRPTSTRKRPFTTAVVLAVVALVAGLAAAELHSVLSYRNEKGSIEGVENFGRIDSQIYRGAQPTTDGFTRLRALGIGTVVRLSLGEEGAAAERASVEALGMRFVGLPWSTAHNPDDAQVVEFLNVVKAHPNEKIFVHCKAGSDRTGVFVATYRIAIDHWSAERAIDEMNAFHYRYVFLPHLQSYVEAFPAKLRTDARFAAFTPTPDVR